jgi:hypothetical protein
LLFSTLPQPPASGPVSAQFEVGLTPTREHEPDVVVRPAARATPLTRSQSSDFSSMSSTDGKQDSHFADCQDLAWRVSGAFGRNMSAQHDTQVERKLANMLRPVKTTHPRRWGGHHQPYARTAQRRPLPSLAGEGAAIRRRDDEGGASGLENGSKGPDMRTVQAGSLGQSRRASAT